MENQVHLSESIMTLTMALWKLMVAKWMSVPYNTTGDGTYYLYLYNRQSFQWLQILRMITEKDQAVNLYNTKVEIFGTISN